MKRLLIAGCGDLGMRLARRLDPRHWCVHGLRRDPSVLPDTIEPLPGDLTDPASLSAALGHWDAVIYQATPGARDEQAYRVTYIEGLRNLLEQISCDRLIFVSSTAVYGQDFGEFVDETSPTGPKAFNGRILLEAEALAAGIEARSIVVRFAGIYGPGRDYLISQLRAGRAECRPEPPQWTNRIHADDCAGVLAHLLEATDPAALYCGVDDRPASRCEVLDWLAGQLGVAGPERLDTDDARSGQGKRVSNDRLKASGYTFIYPDYVHGYGALLT